MLRNGLLKLRKNVGLLVDNEFKTIFLNTKDYLKNIIFNV